MTYLRLKIFAVPTVLFVLAGCGDDQKKKSDQPAASNPSPITHGSSNKGSFSPEAIYKQVSPGVVTVTSIFKGSNNSLQDLLNGQQPQEGATGTGSGFVISKDGEIVTNTHVVTQENGEGRASEVYVQFGDDNQVKAKIVGTDPNADVALLKIDPKGLNLKPLSLGTNERIRVGAPIAVIGSPYNEPQSLSVGVVSAINRSIKSLTNFEIAGAIQTDAAINPGNSGGAIVDGEGHVIAIAQQIKTSSGSGSGVGFGVPVNTAKRSIDQLRANGRVDYAYLGVSSVPVYPQLADKFDLGVKSGALVQQIQKGGPASKSALKGGSQRATFQVRSFVTGGDVITKVDNHTISNSTDLSEVISRYKPRDRVRLTVYRKGEQRVIAVTLQKRPASS